MASTAFSNTHRKYEGKKEEVLKKVIEFNLLDQPIFSLKVTGEDYHYLMDRTSLYWGGMEAVSVWPGEMAKFILMNLLEERQPE